MAEHIKITDVGLRDGLQMLPDFVPTADKLKLGRALRAAGLHSLEAAAFVSPKAVPQMADGAELMTALLSESAEPDISDPVDYWALIPNERGYDRAREVGVNNIAVVLSATDGMNRANINMSVEDSMAVFERVIARCRADGVQSRAYVSAAFVCPYEGLTDIEIVLGLTERLLAFGADEVCIADTIGAGTPDHCAKLIGELTRRWDPALFSLHLHDTRAMALTMAWVGAQEGLRHFDGSIGGLGGCPFAPGAAGNVATEDLVFMFDASGFDTGVDIDALRRATHVAEEITGLTLGGRISKFLRSQEAKANAAD